MEKPKPTGQVPATSPRKQKRALTHRQSLFVVEYLKDGNATQAAYRAVYSPLSCESIGYQLLQIPIVLEAIERQRSEDARAFTVTRHAILKEMAAIAFSDQRDFTEWDNNKVKLRSSKHLGARTKAVQEVIYEKGPKGERVSLKLYDKKGALNDLYDRLGFAKDKRADKQDQDELADRMVQEMDGSKET